MNLTHLLRAGWLTALKYTLNPLTRRLARSSFGPFALIRHVGRRSGKRYETPVIARPLQDSFVIELTYGPDVDWHKNIVAGGGGVLWHGAEYLIDRIEPLDAETGRAAFSPWQRLILRLLRRTHFEQLKVQRREGP